MSKGDDQALVELYNRYHLGIYNYAARLTGDPDVAEDILQEVYIAVWQGASRFRHNSSVKTWIYRITHNQAVSWIRKHKRMELAKDAILEEPLDLEESIAKSWRAEEIRAALEMLNPIHRATVELAFVHELSYAEIGEVLDCPVGTVKSRMSNAIRNLERILRSRSWTDER